MSTKLVRAAAAGAIAATFPLKPLTERKLVLAARISARALCDAREPAPWVLLGALALASMAAAGYADDPGRDLLAAGEALRRIEQYALAFWALEKSAAFGTPEHGPLARTRDLVDELAMQGAGRVAGDELVTENALQERAVGARRVLEALDEIRDLGRDDPLLSGLRQALETYAQPNVDLSQARSGLVRALGHWRSLRGLGQLPPAATAALDTAIDLLLIEASSDEVILLAELLEALADGGLNRGEVGRVPGNTSLTVQAALSRRASERPVWPDLARLLARLDGRDVLLLHQRRSAAGATDVICLYLATPSGFALRRARLDAVDQAVLDRLSGGSPAGLLILGAGDIDRVAAKVVREVVAQRLAGPAARELVIVPNGQISAVPWAAASVGGRPWAMSPVVICPSMSVASQLPVPGRPFRTIHALVDERIADCRNLLAALGGRAVVHRSLDSLPAKPAPDDVLLVFAHGFGEGLDYRMDLPAARIGVLDLADAPLPQRVVLAACRSGGPPPLAYPLAAPTALLLAGASMVVAGLWPLATGPTADVLAEALNAPDGRLAAAVRQAQAARGHLSLSDRVGLAVFGRDDSAC